MQRVHCTLNLKGKLDTLKSGSFGFIAWYWNLGIEAFGCVFLCYSKHMLGAPMHFLHMNTYNIGRK